MTVEFAMPNLYQLVVSHIKTPNPMAARITELLEGLGLVGPTTAAQRAAYAQDTILGVMELASLCLVKPRLVLEGTPGEGEVGPEAFAYSDWTELLGLFRRDPPVPPATDSEPGTTPEATPDGA